MKKLALTALLLPLIASCAAIPIAAAAAVGVWSYDQNTASGGGSLPVESSMDRAWAAAKAVALDRAAGEPLEIREDVNRITGTIDGFDCYIRILPFESTTEIVEIKVSAQQGLVGRGHFARELAEEIAERL